MNERPGAMPRIDPPSHLGDARSEHRGLRFAGGVLTARIYGFPSRKQADLSWITRQWPLIQREIRPRESQASYTAADFAQFAKSLLPLPRPRVGFRDTPTEFAAFVLSASLGAVAAVHVASLTIPAGSELWSLNRWTAAAFTFVMALFIARTSRAFPLGGVITVLTIGVTVSVGATATRGAWHADPLSHSTFLTSVSLFGSSLLGAILFSGIYSWIRSLGLSVPRLADGERTGTRYALATARALDDPSALRSRGARAGISQMLDLVAASTENALIGHPSGLLQPSPEAQQHLHRAAARVRKFRSAVELARDGCCSSAQLAMYTHVAHIYSGNIAALPAVEDDHNISTPRPRWIAITTGIAAGLTLALLGVAKVLPEPWGVLASTVGITVVSISLAINEGATMTGVLRGSRDITASP